MTAGPTRYPAARTYFTTWLTDNDLSARQLAELIYPGDSRSSGSLSYWLYGYGKANDDVMHRVAKALKVPVEEIAALYEERVDLPVEVVNHHAARSVVKQVMALTVAEPPVVREPPVTPVLSVIMLSSGKMRIKLDVELDHKDGLPLAQMLYGVHGLIREEQ